MFLCSWFFFYYLFAYVFLIDETVLDDNADFFLHRKAVIFRISKNIFLSLQILYCKKVLFC